MKDNICDSVIEDMPTLGQLDYSGPDAVSAADLNALAHLLVELRDRAERAERTIPEGGGRGRAFAGCTASPMDHCAMLISEAWCIVHDEHPKPGNQTAQQAASALWRASGGIEKGWGTSPSGWRKHFQAIELYDESEMSQQTNLTTLPVTWVSGAVWPSCPLSGYGRTSP